MGCRSRSAAVSWVRVFLRVFEIVSVRGVRVHCLLLWPLVGSSLVSCSICGRFGCCSFNIIIPLCSAPECLRLNNVFLVTIGGLPTGLNAAGPGRTLQSANKPSKEKLPTKRSQYPPKNTQRHTGKAPPPRPTSSVLRGGWCMVLGLMLFGVCLSLVSHRS